MSHTTRSIYQGRILQLGIETLTLPNGETLDLEIVRHPGGAAVVAVDERQHVCLLRQYRHATGQDLLELPAGTLDDDEDPEVCAAREIREETGMAAGVLTKLGDFYLAPGYSTEFMVVYLATDLSHSPLEADADEFLSVESLPVAEAMQMAERGEIPDAKSLAALFLAKPHLEKWL